MTDNYIDTTDQDIVEDLIDARSVLDGDEEVVLGSEISTLVEDSSVADDIEEIPLDEVSTPLSEAATAVDDEEEASPTLSIRRVGVHPYPNHSSRHIPSDPPPLENALGLDLGPPISIHPFDTSSESPAAEAPSVERPEPRPTPRNLPLRRLSEPRYATPAVMVAPDSLDCPSISRMLSTRRRRTRPDPEEVRSVWEQYSDQWRGLLDADPNQDDVRHTLDGSRVPWPILDYTSNSITPDDIQDLLLSSAHSTDLPVKKRIREALRLYHPDRFEKLVIERIENEDERARVRDRAGMVVRSLNALLERES
ncbi:hypothetical protein FRC04_010918 [Tulasnella sp. 424]|nr:hypothetical protein FRC04_010918 [Tulasnella sp. 424]KAG8975721.1 hypothetical protein FRC05_005239 [Tulasnella sp. 425]